MTYLIRYSSESLKFLEKLPAPIAKRIFDSISELGKFDRNELMDRNFEPLKGRISGILFYKHRIGPYRAICQIVEEEDVIFIALIGHRKSVYKIIHDKL
ncbi:MAG TPA: type II toxin-antitoxin system RelE/ParE family toxin [Methanoregulaceae archaeon]|nr:type II toxin-antitoxin system RelE/ParE family toxin [Methanoregulaceae archaeon]